MEPLEGLPIWTAWATVIAQVVGPIVTLLLAMNALRAAKAAMRTAEITVETFRASHRPSAAVTWEIRDIRRPPDHNASGSAVVVACIKETRGLHTTIHDARHWAGTGPPSFPVPEGQHQRWEKLDRSPIYGDVVAEFPIPVELAPPSLPRQVIGGVSVVYTFSRSGDERNSEVWVAEAVVKSNDNWPNLSFTVEQSSARFLQWKEQHGYGAGNAEAPHRGILGLWP